MIYSQGCSGRKSWQNDISGMLYHWNRLLHENLESDVEHFISSYNVNPGEIKQLRKIRRCNSDINIISKRMKEIDCKKRKKPDITRINSMIEMINEKSMDYFTQQKPVLAKPIHEKSYYFFENENERSTKHIKHEMYGMHIIQDNDPMSSVYIYDKNADNSNNVFSFPTTSKDGNVVYFDNKERLKKDSVSLRAYHHFREISSKTSGVILLSEIIDFFTLEGYKRITIIDTSCRTWEGNESNENLNPDDMIRNERNLKRKLK
jgi:hypothetical protein